MLRWWSQRGTGRAREAVRVIARAPLGRSSAVQVVEVGTRRLVLGVSEQSVTLLRELDPDEILGAPDAPKDPNGSASDAIGSPSPVEASGLPLTSLMQSKGMDREALEPESSQRPWIGLLPRARRMTTRTPRGVRVHVEPS